MNIGAYFSKTKPESGGGFTFQEEILKALLRQAVNVPQNIFYIIATSADLEKHILKFNPPKNLKFLLLNKSNILLKPALYVLIVLSVSLRGIVSSCNFFSKVSRISIFSL